MKRTLWETYFDDSVSRRIGRRVRKGFPKDRLVDIIGSLGLDFTVSEGRYPRQPFRVVKKIEVEYDGSKEELIKKIMENAFKKE
ncbi:MAG: hypothetical protein ACP5UO_02155 [Thermoplasmata archaeon]